MGLNRLRRIKIGGFFFVNSHYVGTQQILLLLLLLLEYVKITLLTDIMSPLASILLVFSSLLVSAVMFHASVSEQTPDTPVSLAV